MYSTNEDITDLYSDIAKIIHTYYIQVTKEIIAESNNIERSVRNKIKTKHCHYEELGSDDRKQFKTIASLIIDKIQEHRNNI